MSPVTLSAYFSASINSSKGAIASTVSGTPTVPAKTTCPISAAPGGVLPSRLRAATERFTVLRSLGGCPFIVLLCSILIPIRGPLPVVRVVLPRAAPALTGLLGIIVSVDLVVDVDVSG